MRRIVVLASEILNVTLLIDEAEIRMELENRCWIIANRLQGISGSSDPSFASRVEEFPGPYEVGSDRGDLEQHEENQKVHQHYANHPH